MTERISEERLAELEDEAKSDARFDDVSNFVPSRDLLALISAARHAERLAEATASHQRILGFMKSAILSGEEWSDTAEEMYRAATKQIDAALNAYRGEGS